MSIFVLVEAKVKAECVDTLNALMVSALPDTRAFAGCEHLTILVNQDNRQNYVFVEKWESYEAYQRYLAWRTENGTFAQLISLLEAPPTIRSFDIVPV